MDENYKRWAKANPKLAAKVKKGQAGYDAINSKGNSSSPRSTKSGTSARGAGNGAPGASGAAQREQQRQTQGAKPKATKKGEK